MKWNKAWQTVKVTVSRKKRNKHGWDVTLGSEGVPPVHVATKGAAVRLAKEFLTGMIVSIKPTPPPKMVMPTGTCYHCGDPAEPGRILCPACGDETVEET